MTVPVQVPSVVHTGNGVTTTFSYPYLLLLATDLIATIDGELVPTVGYTISGVGKANGGSVNFNTPPPAASRIVMRRDVGLTRVTDYQYVGDFQAKTVNNDFDRLWMALQDQSLNITTALRFQPDDTTNPLLPPVAGRALTTLGFGSEGELRLIPTSVSDSTGLALALVSATGSSIVGYRQAGAGAVTRTMQDKLRDTVNVKDFGAKGDGVTDDTAAFFAARDYLQTASNYRGGVIEIGRGNFKISQEWAFTPYVAGVVFNIEIRGDGMESTVLDFASAPGGSNGISATGHGLSFFVSGLSVKNAKQHGIQLKGGTVGSTSFIARCGLHNVRIQASGGDGLRSENSYMLDLDHVWSFINTGAGFNFVGLHTSLNCRTSYAQSNGSAGWLVNGVVYFHFAACGSDSNGTQGYAISNVQGGVFTGCGAETNTRDGWLLFTSTSSITGIPTVSQNVHGIVFAGCYGLQNSTAGAGLYATFLAALTANSRPIDFSIHGGAAHGASPSDVALVLNGVSGAITCTKDTFYDGAFSANDVLSGAASVRNNSVSGRRIVAGLPVVTQSVANNAATALALIGAPTVNDLGATVSANTVQIPRGVNKVIVSASVFFAANATGVRQLFLYKGGVPFSGLPALTSNAVSAGATVLSVTSPPISVVPGDNFSASVLQTSGGALNIEQAAHTFLSVEAVG